MRRTTNSLFLRVILQTLVVAVLSLVMSSTVLAKSPQRFKTSYVSLIQKENRIESISSFNLYLSKLSSKALSQGVPINIVLSYATPKKTLFITSYSEIEKTEFKLSKHALSDTYLLENLTTYRNLQFPTIEDALIEISSIQIKSLDTKKLNDNKVAIRIHLDLFKLPPQIRARSFFSGRWRHDSGWSVWSVAE